MKFFLPVILILFILSDRALAQEDESIISSSRINSNRKYKNEIAIDISPLKFILSDYSANYPSIFFRRHFTKDKPVKSLSGINITTYNAYRFRLGSNLSFRTLKTPDIRDPNLVNRYFSFTSSLSDNSYSSFFLRVGRERQMRFNKFELFYGADLFFLHEKFCETQMSGVAYNLNTPEFNYSNYRWSYVDSRTKMGIGGIGGFKYFLIPRLCFSTEATVDIGYFTRKFENSFERYDSFNEEYMIQSSAFDVREARISLNPIFVINIGFYF